jgi:diguanylate cyclase (GGDEF)-like protein
MQTGVTTLAVNILAVLGSLLGNSLANRPSLPVDFYTSIVLATLFTVPLFGFLTIKLQELRLANEQLRVFATTDFLTGTLNRRAFMERVEARLVDQVINQSRRGSALLVIDVDHFKVINDRYGHQIGDLALVRIADTICANLRVTDLFGRLGGEEFGVYIDDISAREAVLVAERCRLAINRCSFTPEGERHILSISIGVAISGPGEDFASMFKEADSRLYLAKEHGRNRIEPAFVPHAA